MRPDDQLIYADCYSVFIAVDSESASWILSGQDRPNDDDSPVNVPERSETGTFM